MVAYTQNKNLTQPANGDDVDDWDVPVNANWASIDAAFGGTTTLNAVGASGTVVLTTTQYTPPFVTISGALTANVTYQLPSGVGGEWSVNNATTGSFTVTWASAGGGTSVNLPQGKRTVVQADGTNIFTGPAASGANADITSLSGLTTPLSVSQGGTGGATASAAWGNLAAGAEATANTFTATQTFDGSSSSVAAVVLNAAEPITTSATAATGTVALYVGSQSLLYFTANASANWTTNLTFGASTTLNSVMTTGQVVTVSFWVTQGSTAYYNSSVQVDGGTSGVTTKWIGGAPTSGSANGIDLYTYAITKTGSGTFTVIASKSAAS